MSFSCWATLLRNLDGEDVSVLLDTTFFIAGNYWEPFDRPSRNQCQDLMAFLLEKHKSLLKERIAELPSFAHIPELADIETKLKAMRKPLDNRATFLLFAKRLGHENSGVVVQTLAELAAYLQANQGFLQTSAISEQPDRVVTDLARALLDCSAKYNGRQPDVARLCVQCIGLVGCFDSNRLETVREQRQFVVVNNFEDGAETGDFALFILQEVLVKAFLSATDPSFQGFLSYTMQELLDKCDFKASVAWQGGELEGAEVALRARDAEEIYKKWLALPDSVREVLTPFMTSRYLIQPIAHKRPQYPVFRPGRSYAAWLRSLVVDLLHQGQNAIADMVFEPLSRVIKVNDLAVAEFLLPYLVIHVVVGEETVDNYRTKVLNEVLAILQHQVADDASYADRENMKMYYEVCALPHLHSCLTPLLTSPRPYSG